MFKFALITHASAVTVGEDLFLFQLRHEVNTLHKYHRHKNKFGTHRFYKSTPTSTWETTIDTIYKYPNGTMMDEGFNIPSTEKDYVYQEGGDPVYGILLLFCDEISSKMFFSS